MTVCLTLAHISMVWSNDDNSDSAEYRYSNVGNASVYNSAEQCVVNASVYNSVSLV